MSAPTVTRAVFHRGRPAGYRGRQRRPAGPRAALVVEVARTAGVVAIAAVFVAIAVVGILAGPGL